MSQTAEANDSIDYADGLSIALSPSPVKKRRKYREVLFDMNKEIEDEIEDQLKKKAKKSNLTVANVKSILRHVIANEHLIAMVKKSMRSSNDGNEDLDFFEPKLTRSKTKELLQSQPAIVWPITPIKNMPENEHLVFINEELPEESDDEEYRPNPDDLQDQSEEESGRQSVVSSISRTSALDNSCISQYLESFDPNLLDGYARERSDKLDDSLFKIPEENIGQRTRSKLCLSNTPLEAIEKAFVPPDITTDMYDFNCDNEDWENFLKEFMQPWPSDINDLEDDDEADPEYNVLADEEVVDKEELRRDKAVKIPRKELRKLMAELFDECLNEISSDEEEEKKVRSEITSEAHFDHPENANCEEDIETEPACPVTSTQRLLIQQQMRQHVQLTTQHFLQTHQHPLYNSHAKECKVMIGTLVELAKEDEKWLYNVYNLVPAFSLIEKWETHLLSERGAEVIEHMKSEVALAKKAKKENNFYRVSFHSSLMEMMVKSDVFLYPLLLPPFGFRCDGPHRVEFVASEDRLIAIGLEEFTQFLVKNPRWFDRKKNTEKAAIELMCQYLLPAKKPDQVARHIRNFKDEKDNPIQHYRQNKKAPKTVHYVIPFNNQLTKPLCQQPADLLPRNFRVYIYPKTVDDDKENEKEKVEVIQNAELTLLRPKMIVYL